MESKLNCLTITSHGFIKQKSTVKWTKRLETGSRGEYPVIRVTELFQTSKFLNRRFSFPKYREKKLKNQKRMNGTLIRYGSQNKLNNQVYIYKNIGLTNCYWSNFTFCIKVIKIKTVCYVLNIRRLTYAYITIIKLVHYTKLHTSH